jgi:serine/threonine protein kinase/tetratricopeptide (TPR) repeat protein
MNPVDDLDLPLGTELADLIEEFAARVQSGQLSDPEAFISAHPEHAKQLRSLLPAVQALAELGSHPSCAADAQADFAGSRLGDFRLLREVGRGGMGIVFEAEQISLGRHVAVKVLPSAAALDERHLQRFHNEVQAAALLQHPHIVPVLAVGQDHQTHYFAMQLIDGDSLAAYVADLSGWVHAGSKAPTLLLSPSPEPSPAAPANGAATVVWHADPEEGIYRLNPLATRAPGRDREYFQKVGRLLIQAAEALDHAHQAGVIHRDVKPANLLVDAQGELWITDFGLARLSSSPGVTATGDLLGTIRYMSPEQAQAMRVPVDHRTDIYGLGVTAYELLAFQPAFAGDRPQDLLRRIATEEPTRPRKLNPAVPAELEAVVLKAMEKNPADRYATAQEFADDLSRFLVDRPVRARRPSVWRLTARWTRRHAGMVVFTASAAAAVLLVLVVAVCTLAVKNEDLKRERDKVAGLLQLAEQNATEAKQNAQRAEHNAARATRNGQRVAQTMNEVLMTMADSRLKQDPRWVNKAAGVLDRARKMYQEQAADADGDLQLQLDVTLGYHQVGSAYGFLGRYDQSFAVHRQAADLAESLVKAMPREFIPRVLLAMSHREIGALYLNLGQRDQATAAFQQALADWERPVPMQMCPYEGSLTNAGLADLEAAAGQGPAAAKHYRAAIALRGPLLAAQPGIAPHRWYLAAWRRGLGSVLLQLGERAEATSQLRLAWQLAERLVKDHKDVEEYQLEFTRSSSHLAALYEVRDPKAAERYLRQALETGGALSAASPGVPGYRQGLAEFNFRLGELAFVAGRHDEALTHFGRARELFTALAAKPADGGHGAGVPGAAENGFAWILAACPDETFRDPRRAVELARIATSRAPAKPDYWNTLGAAHYRAGNAAEAVKALKEAVRLRKEGDDMDLLWLALAHRRLGEAERARACYDQAVAWAQQHKAESLQQRWLFTEAASSLGLRPPPLAEPTAANLRPPPTTSDWL